MKFFKIVGIVAIFSINLFGQDGIGNTFSSGVQSTFYALAEQLEYFYKQGKRDNKGHECPCLGVVDTFKHRHIITISEFEYSVYLWFKKAQAIEWDGFTSYLRLRGYLKGFLIFLEQFGSQIKNHNNLIFDTDAVKWSAYRTENGNYNFNSDNEEKFSAIASDIIAAIEKVYQEQQVVICNK